MWPDDGHEGRLIFFATIERDCGRLVGSPGTQPRGKAPALTVFVDSSVLGAGLRSRGGHGGVTFSLEKHAFGNVIATVMVENVIIDPLLAAQVGRQSGCVASHCC